VDAAVRAAISGEWAAAADGGLTRASYWRDAERRGLAIPHQVN
jgi:hypothetical protein